MPNIWWMPIQTRTEMLATGVRSAVGIKVFGPDLAAIERDGGRRSRAALRDVPGTRSAFAERLTGGFYLDFDVDRDAAARYGLTVGDVQDVIETAIGGMTVSQTVEGRERYAISVRYARELPRRPRRRSSACWCRRPRRAGAARAGRDASTFATGPPMVRSEDGQLVGLVSVDVAGRADRRLRRGREARGGARASTLPPGYRIDWAGQFEYFERAKARLALVVPLTLLLVSLLLYLNTRSVVETAIVHARGAVLAGRRRLAALAARLQPERRGLGRDHRARGARRRDRRGDAALPQARPPRARASAGGCATARDLERGDRRGRGAPDPAEADDGARDPVRAAADPAGDRAPART